MPGHITALGFHFQPRGDQHLYTMRQRVPNCGRVTLGIHDKVSMVAELSPLVFTSTLLIYSDVACSLLNRVLYQPL